MLRELFGSSKEEIWRQVANEIVGARYVPGGPGQSSKVQVYVNQWTITLDTIASADGQSGIPRTRMRAPYVNKDGFWFSLHRQDLFSEIGKFLGMQDIEVADAAFNQHFILQANNAAKAKTLFSHPRIRELLMAQLDLPTAILLQVSDEDSPFAATFPEGVDELRFEVIGVINDIDRLKSLYELFAEILNTLCHMGSAYEDDPHITL